MNPTLEQIHDRWAMANHNGYAEGQERTDYLRNLIMAQASKNVSILEIGCNIGRNLNGLLEAGFTDLTGLDINPNTEFFRQLHFPELQEKGKFIYQSLESFIESKPEPFSLVYTMAVLEHIHPDSEWALLALSELIKPRGFLVIIEDELNKDGFDFVFPRKYKEAFPGLSQILEEDSRHVPGLKEGYMTRIFRKSMFDSSQKEACDA